MRKVRTALDTAIRTKDVRSFSGRYGTDCKSYGVFFNPEIVHTDIFILLFNDIAEIRGVINRMKISIFLFIDVTSDNDIYKADQCHYERYRR